MQFGVKGQGFVWAYRLNTGSKPCSGHDLSPEFLTQGYLQPVRKIARKPQNLDPNDPKPMTDRTRFHLSDLRLEPRSVSATKAHPKPRDSGKQDGEPLREQCSVVTLGCLRSRLAAEPCLPSLRLVSQLAVVSGKTCSAVEVRMQTLHGFYN